MRSFVTAGPRSGITLALPGIAPPRVFPAFSGRTGCGRAETGQFKRSFEAYVRSPGASSLPGVPSPRPAEAAIRSPPDARPRAIPHAIDLDLPHARAHAPQGEGRRRAPREGPRE